MQEKNILIDDTNIVSELFGKFDENIRIIEKEFNVDILLREGEIKISGEQLFVALAEKLIYKLIDILKSEKKLTKQEIMYTIQLIYEGKEEKVKELLNETICITASGKSIKPKTLGQKKYVDAIKNVNDMIIVTDISGRITYITGSVDYKQGWVFGLKYLDDILDGEKIQDGNKMLKGLDSLIIGVPIKRSQEPLWDVKQKQLYENEIESRALQEIIGAVYIVTPLEPLETTIQAIKIQFLYIFIGAIIISSLIALLLSHSFSDPLIKINDAAKEIARGNYNTKIHLKSSREIITLGETINNLARQLSRVEQIRREFIANVSHELRTPLSYLKGYTEILIDGLAETDSDREKYLNIILEESERLRKMVDEILHLSQIEAGSIQLKLSSFSIDALIKRTIDKILPLAVKRDISIKYNKVDDDLLLCLADENRIKQVLINLLTNATKHSYDHSNILISSYRLNDRIYICVRDFGEGISEEHLPSPKSLTQIYIFYH